MVEQKYRIRIAVSAGLVTFAVLLWLTVQMPQDASKVVPGFIFGLLLLLTTTFGVLLAQGEVSLLPMTALAAYLVMGAVPAAWAALFATLAHGLVRLLWAEELGLPQRPDPRELAGLTAANATMHTASILLGDLVYRGLGGTTPLFAVDIAWILPFVCLALTYLAVNYSLAAMYIAARDKGALRDYARSIPDLLLYEGGPMLLSPLMALIYTRLGQVMFALFALALGTVSLITRSLALTSRRLERRLMELGSLQAVGQALSASLRVESVLDAIHDQVTGLMRARNFYAALYDAEADEVSFPLATEHGQQVRWRSRRAGNGLTEYVLRSRAPLLIRGEVEPVARRLGVEQYGTPAVCWLGVPLLSADEVLGVIAVQSYSTPDAYDVSHLEVLETIASQAALAIQNARLYARTDQALARRVQELSSILRTAREGILLFDTGWRVLAANLAFAELTGIAQAEWVGESLANSGPEEGASLLSRLGYARPELEAACEALAEKSGATEREIMVLNNAQDLHVERTLSPVRDDSGSVAGWLLTLRDVTEEVELDRLRDQMGRMLVHDLRSPLSVIKGGLDMMELVYEENEAEDFAKLLSLTQRTADQILQMVNDLLDISKLESGQQVLHREPAVVADLVRSAIQPFDLLLNTAQLALEVDLQPDLPLVLVDLHLMRRALGNLVDNAVKFTPDGGCVRVWARLETEQAPGAVLVGVTDSGPGIAPEVQERLFQLYERSGSTVSRRPGSGVGLAFCKLAVEAHGGRIWVESEPGQGSTFILNMAIADGAGPMG
jgi:NtrC-family two-component system sensor histidine kinase KinB